MENWMIEAIGLLAGAMTSFSMVPQAVQAYKTRSVGDISLAMYLLLCLGVALWIVYGLLIDSLSVIAANIVSLILCAFILGMKVAYGRDAESLAKIQK